MFDHFFALPLCIVQQIPNGVLPQHRVVAFGDGFIYASCQIGLLLNLFDIQHPVVLIITQQFAHTLTDVGQALVEFLQRLNIAV